MSWEKKINSKKYAIGTFINLAFALYAGFPSLKVMWWLSYIVISTVLNHYFMVMALSKVVEQMTEIGASKRSRLFYYLILKAVFLISGFVCLMVFIPNMVLHGLFIYIFQLIILGLSIKNIGNLFYRGP